MDITSILSVIKRLGLTEYEAKCYIQLVLLGPTDPRKIAAEGGIPYPNAYESLKRLEGRGWVEIIRRRPAIYKAKRPDIIRQEILSEINEAFNSLESVYKAVPSEDTELVFTIRTKKKVVSKIYELLDSATESIFVVGPSISFTEANLIQTLSEIVDRGVRVRVISDQDIVSSLRKGVDARIGRLVAFDLLVDERIAMIALPDLSACGWADSEAVAKHFLQFLELMWTNSKS